MCKTLPAYVLICTSWVQQCIMLSWYTRAGANSQSSSSFQTDRSQLLYEKKSLAVVTSNPCTCTSYWLNKQIRFHSQNDRTDSEYINIRFEKQKGFVYSVCVVVYSVKNTLLFSLSLMLLELIYDLSTNTSPSKRPF